MNKKSTALTVTVIIVIVLLSSTFAFSYALMGSEINVKNSEISNLTSKISAQNSTISAQTNAIANMKSNETNMSLIIADLQSEIALAKDNSSEARLLINEISSIYGIQTYIIAYNMTLNVAAHQHIDFWGPVNNPSKNTTIAVLDPSQILQVGESSNNTYFNLTLLLNNPGEYSFSEMTAGITEPSFAIYIDNVGNVSETFNITVLEMWRT